jgi:hypothetical protein
MKAALDRRGSVGPSLPLAALVAFVAAMAALPLLLAYNASPAHAADTCTATISDTTTCTFDTPGTSAWTVPAGVTQATFDVFGAQGGSEPTRNRAGGTGGEATATISVTPGDTLQVNVGGRGGDGDLFGLGGAGGFNGGADGGSGFYSGPGGGGGASDVRSGAFELADRIIVAGGGGGSGGFGGGWGGVGGVPDGGPGRSGGGGAGGLGGTQVAGGAGGLGHVEDGERFGDDGSKGDLGTGGGGGFGLLGGDGGGGGGGGYYGGGGGGGGLDGGGGGGGSGFGPSGVVFKSNDHSGDGLVRITYTTAPPDTTPPTITKASIKNAAGTTYAVGTWTNQTVTATFDCSDAGSGPVANSVSDSTTT